MNKLFIILGSTALILFALAISGCNEVEKSKEQRVETVTPTIVVSPPVNTARELEVSVVTEANYRELANKPCTIACDEVEEQVETEKELQIGVDTEQ